MSKKICIVTMVNGNDIIGELDTIGKDCVSDFAALWRPCIVRFTPPTPQSPASIQLHELLRGSPFLAGEYVELNLRAVQWIGKAPKELAAAYLRVRSGLIVPPPADVAVNG
jgi:hypothetical protein